jgi:hypothetical protein
MAGWMDGRTDGRTDCHFQIYELSTFSKDLLCNIKTDKKCVLEETSN